MLSCDLCSRSSVDNTTIYDMEPMFYMNTRRLNLQVRLVIGDTDLFEITAGYLFCFQRVSKVNIMKSGFKREKALFSEILLTTHESPYLLDLFL